MNTGLYKGMFEKAERMGWFFLPESDFIKVRNTLRESLELEQININNETISWTRVDWYKLFLIPLYKELEKRRLKKSDAFVYLKYADNLTIEEISSIFKLSPYIVVKELFYFLLESNEAKGCSFSRTSNLFYLSLLNEKLKNDELIELDRHLTSCEECQKLQKVTMSNMYQYKKRIVTSEKSFGEFCLMDKKPSKKVGFFNSGYLFS